VRWWGATRHRATALEIGDVPPTKIRYNEKETKIKLMEKRNMGHEERYEENDTLHDLLDHSLDVHKQVLKAIGNEPHPYLAFSVDLLNQIIEELEPFQVGEEGGKP